jgi:YegS/Rv2252/BmrU family lipid kinase
VERAQAHVEITRRPEALLLANPICLHRHGLELASLKQLIERHGLTCEAHTLENEAIEAPWTEQLARGGYNVVIAAGGDGTVHQVVNLMADTRLPLGVLPLGTANDFARALGLPTDMAGAVRVIAEDTAIPVDLGVVNGHYFLNAAHLGMGVETAKRTNARLKEMIGPLAYILAAAQAWMNTEPLDLEVCVGNSCSNFRASQLLVGNGRYFGGGMVIARDATLDDGLLDVHVLAAHIGPAEALKLAAAARLGAMEDMDGIAHYRTERLTARLSRPAEVNLDGELVNMEQQLEFAVLPGALQVFARAAGVTPIWVSEGLASEMI